MNTEQSKVYFDAPPPDIIKKKTELLNKLNYECATADERREVLKRLLGACPKKISVTPLFYCDYGFNIFIGECFYSNYNLTILDCAKVTIGNNVFIAPNVGIYSVGHPIDKDIRRAGVEFSAPIDIGEDVWIGGHTVINPGVNVGSGTVIGSGSVVTHDIESGVVVAGNPARVIRKVDARDKEYYFKDRKYPQEILSKIHFSDNRNQT